MSDTPSILPPTEPYLEMFHYLDAGLKGLIAERALLMPSLGCYESEVEAMLICDLTIRHIEGFLNLARNDMILLAPASTIARAAMEAGIKSAWLVHPDDKFDREARYLAHLRSEERFQDNLHKDLYNVGIVVPFFEQNARVIEAFANEHEGKMPEKTKKLRGQPSVDEMIISLGARAIAKSW